MSVGGSDESYRFEQIVNDAQATDAEAKLLSDVFPNTDRYTAEYLNWQYFDNPDGDIVGFNAVDSSGALAAHYVVQPLMANLFGKATRGVLSLNTATHPNHQGKGLFIKLAQQTYALAAEQGYEFVVGVANANSTPGFIRKLAFQLVAPLEARIGIGRPTVRSYRSLEFERTWTPRSREWRMTRPNSGYWTAGGTPFAPTEYRGVRACLSADDSWTQNRNSTRSVTPITTWIGLHPDYRWTLSTSIPKRLRPSPLNFIFLPLGERKLSLDKAKIAVEPVDFDAF